MMTVLKFMQTTKAKRSKTGIKYKLKCADRMVAKNSD